MGYSSAHQESARAYRKTFLKLSLSLRESWFRRAQEPVDILHYPKKHGQRSKSEQSWASLGIWTTHGGKMGWSAELCTMVGTV